MTSTHPKITPPGPRRNIYDEIAANRFKTVLIFVLFFGMVLIIGIAYGAWIGDIIIGTLLAGFLGAIYCPIAYMAGDSMILTLSSAKPARKQEYPYLINTVEGLAIAAGIPMPKVYVIEDTAINAFATGRNPQHAAITTTTGALTRLNRTELEGVLAHEMSHIKNYDIRVMMLAAVMVGLIALLSDFFLRNVLYSRSHGGSGDRKAGNIELILVILGIFLAILSPFIAQFIQLAVSRRREFLADASGALLTRYPDGLVSALKKIGSYRRPLETATNATAHLFFENPFGADRSRGERKTPWIIKLFSTHPPIEDRIRALEHMRN